MANTTFDIGSITKKDDLEIRAALTKFKNEFYIDIREYIQTDDYSGPTKKGVRFHTENWDAFYTLMKKVDKEIKKRA